MLFVCVVVALSDSLVCFWSCFCVRLEVHWRAFVCALPCVWRCLGVCLKIHRLIRFCVLGDAYACVWRCVGVRLEVHEHAFEDSSAY